ncbi:MAG TPA: phosphoenolpyruvate synthase, partial [Gammaproteobacteria bacterium]|nr:phosphoenolpyruvate synthase [Gammaproteobacteria bacterium]
MAGTDGYIRWFETLTLQDVALVGGKNASLGEMYRALRGQGVPVPNGFAITAEAYWYVLKQAGALPALRETLDGLRPDDISDLARRAARARDMVYRAGIPDDLAAEIQAAYETLQAEYGEEVSLAVRSSATAEDLPTASFAGQQETYLNIQGANALLVAVRCCLASLFTDRAIHYRMERGFDHFKVALSVGVMKMVRSDLSASGVMFSLDTETGFPDVVFITASWGLGENVVQGAVDPDEFYVHKPTYERGYRAVLRRKLGAKKIKMVYGSGSGMETTRNLPTSRAERERYCLGDDDVLKLAGYAIKVEQHYGRPMDMEWARDGLDGEIYLIQARPETVASQRRHNELEEYLLSGPGKVLVRGRAVGTKIAAGRVRRIADVSELPRFQAGEVLVADITTPDWEPVMKQAAAIVTNRGGRTCHAAIVARELGIPAVVGAAEATELLSDGLEVTVSCAEGDEGRVYEGRVPFEVRRTDLTRLARPATEIMVNLGNPELAFQTALLPCDGVGLARMEFIINQHIKAHPMALLYPDKVRDPAQRDALA